MGDSWEHRIQIEKQLGADPEVSYPRFVDGAMRCPPEDVGGIPGFYGFLEAIADPRHPDHDEQLDWHGGPFGPDNLDLDRINKELNKITTRDNVPPRSAAPKRTAFSPSAYRAGSHAEIVHAIGSLQAGPHREALFSVPWAEITPQHSRLSGCFAIGCAEAMSGSGTDQPCRPVRKHFCYWRLTGCFAAVPLLLDLTRC
jgi:hypothetical protein